MGRFSGIDVRVHWTFFLLLAFFAFIGYQTSGSAVGALTSTLVIVVLFLCVLLHEFGHSLVVKDRRFCCCSAAAQTPSRRHLLGPRLAEKDRRLFEEEGVAHHCYCSIKKWGGE